MRVNTYIYICTCVMEHPPKLSFFKVLKRKNYAQNLQGPYTKQGLVKVCMIRKQREGVASLRLADLWAAFMLDCLREV